MPTESGRHPSHIPELSCGQKAHTHTHTDYVTTSWTITATTTVRLQ